MVKQLHSSLPLACALELVGGDSPLTERGLEYAAKLKEWIIEEAKPRLSTKSTLEVGGAEAVDDDAPLLRDLEKDLVVWTSTMTR